jgi:clan AA aspartic protease
MISGSINSALEGVVRLTVRGPHGQRRRISAVIDTGYNGALTLPSDVIMELGLPWVDTVSVVLGDGSTSDFETFAGFIVWDRRPIRILVDEADTTPLVGMELLHGFKLMMNVERRGEVTIKSLRRRWGR